MSEVHVCPDPNCWHAKVSGEPIPVTSIRVFDKEESAAIRQLFDELDRERARAARAEGAMREARNALAHAGQHCRFHGQDWDFLGREPHFPHPPRCESCKQPFRVTQAIAALTKALGDG